MTLIHENDDVIVETALDGRATCLVTFTPWSSDPPAPPFARGFHEKLGVDAVFFRAKRNDWWEGAGVEAALDWAHERIGSAKRIGYGSSMGAFAAIAFASRLECSDVLALSPQATIDRTIVPWETRWAEEAERYAFSRGNAASHVTSKQTLYLAYDPLVTSDNRHAALICEGAAAGGAKTVSLPFGFSGHPAAAVLNECGMLADLVRATMSRELGRGDFIRRYHERRTRSKAAFFSLLTNRLLLEKHPALTLRAARMLERTSPGLPKKYHFLMARLLYRNNRFSEARQQMDLAIREAGQVAEFQALSERIDFRLSASRAR